MRVCINHGSRNSFRARARAILRFGKCMAKYRGTPGQGAGLRLGVF